MTATGSRLCLLVAGVTLVAGSAFAQEPNPATPGAKPTAPAPNLSEKLNQSNGVIRPKEVDPTMEKPAPKTGDPNVVPPPGFRRHSGAAAKMSARLLGREVHSKVRGRLAELEPVCRWSRSFVPDRDGSTARRHALLPYRTEPEGQQRVGYDAFTKPSGSARYLRITAVRGVRGHVTAPQAATSC